MRPGKNTIGTDIRALEAARRSRAQPAAAASQVPYRPRVQKRANGGLIGPLTGSTPGRADAILTAVPNGSHIVPADVVAALGDGNSRAGFEKLLRLFPRSNPRRAPGGGVKLQGAPHLPAAPHLIGILHPPAGGVPHLAGVPHPGGISGIPQMIRLRLAAGGTSHTVPVQLSDGEFSVAPEDVEALGDGDIERGHKILDAFILVIRNAYIKHLEHLPGPVKS